MTPESERELLTVKEAAEFIGISPGTFFHWLSEHRVPDKAIVRFSLRCIRLKKSELRKWVDQITEEHQEQVSAFNKGGRNR